MWHLMSHCHDHSKKMPFLVKYWKKSTIFFPFCVCGKLVESLSLCQNLKMG
uniref:Uncharacterized protein n=1 Tax=Rhizophora mucronata TaxID=61149 RepID=A0A2P2NVS4_RHIMU